MALSHTSTIGWIGAGRMGYEMAGLLARAGADVLVWNRTRAKAEPLAKYGAKIAGALPELAARDIVFCMVSTWDDVKEVIAGPKGLLSGAFEAADGDRVLVDLARRLRRAARAACGARHRLSRRAGERQREGDQGGQAHVRRVRSEARPTMRRGRFST